MKVEHFPEQCKPMGIFDGEDIGERVPGLREEPK